MAAGAFVIASEEGVAKGTRRVTCLTGAAAAKAIEDAATFSGRIEAAFKMSGDALIAEQKALQTDLRQLVCSAYLKSGYTKKIAELNKLVTKAAEAASQALCQEKTSEAKASG